MLSLTPLVLSLLVAPRSLGSYHILERTILHEPFVFRPSLLDAFQQAASTGAMHWTETEHRYQLTLALPGLRLADLQCSIDHEGILRVVGETKTKHLTSKVDRQVLAPEDADRDTMSVALVDGVLTVTALKRAPVEPRRLTVDPGESALAPEGGYHTTLLVPGIRASELTVTLEHDRMLVIAGESGPTPFRSRSRILRRLKLPKYANSDAVACFLADGVLTVTAPRHDPGALTQEPRELLVQSCLPEDSP